MQSNKNYGLILFTAIFTLFAIVYYNGIILELPFGIHEWAQGDRLAVAMQFYDKGMNFFLPRTNHVYSVDGITPVEFPIHSYLAAALGHVFGREYISVCYRLITITSVYAGLLAMFLAGFRKTKDVYTSLFVPFLIFCSPVFAHYTGTYMPGPMAVGMSLIGFYYFLIYYDTKEFGTLVKAMIFLTLGMLIKATAGILFVAVSAYVVLDIIFIKKLALDKRSIFGFVTVFVISVGLMLGYFFYNQHLADLYNGYIFVVNILPFKSWADVSFYFTQTFKVRYANEYFVLPQYPIIVSLIMTGGILLWKNKERKPLFLFLIMAPIGALSCTYLFGSQLFMHDYYFVAMWIPAMTIILLLAIIELRKIVSGKLNVKLFNITLLSSLLIVFFFADFYVSRRINHDPRQFAGISLKDLPSYWLKGGAQLLDSLKIDKDERILVMGEDPANVGLVYFDRTGMNAPIFSWYENLSLIKESMLSRNIRIMVCDARKIPSIKERFSDFDEVFDEIYVGELKSVYQLND